MDCPNCGEVAPDDAKWCEACGQDLNKEPLPTCVSCGEQEVAEEGYCLSCGHKQPAERDHMESEVGSVAAVTDRGKRHRHNEDAVAIGMSDDGAAILVVCDGVSSTPGSAAASLRAAAAARDLLLAGLSRPEPPQEPVRVQVDAAESDAGELDAAESDAAESDAAGLSTAEPDVAGPAEDTAEPAENADGPDETDAVTQPAVGEAEALELTELDLPVLMARAVEAAQTEAADTTVGADEAVDANAPHSDGGPPSSTFVAVVARPQPDGVALATAWVGDSRAYWVGDEPQRLTGDDHELEGSLVRWLGADTIDATPEIVQTTVSGAGHVVVCSDGMWRYAAEPEELNELVQRLRTGSEGSDEEVGGKEGLELAAAMVAFANESGGHDNISVALWGNGQTEVSSSAAESENH